MSRKFVTAREIDFINRINRELVQRVNGAVVHYYAISIPETKVNKLYNEAIKKSWSPPVHCNARVLWQNLGVNSTKFAPDTDYALEVYLHKQEMIERNVSPKEGDFVEYGGVFFEITAVTTPEIVYGQVNNKVMIKLNCTKAREGQFSAGGISSENRDNTHHQTNTCRECG